MPARGNIEYTQIAEDSRNGTGAWIQMYGGGTVPSPGNMAVFDVNLNVVDGGPPGSGGGGGNLVTSVFGRTGAVVGAAGDYSAAQITNAVDATQSYTNPSWIVSIPYSKITGAPITGVGSWNGRTGAVMPMTGDYTVAMIPGAVADPTTTIGDILVRGISSIARLGVGSNGQVLTADSTQPLGVHWATPTGGGSGSQTPWLSDIQGANFSLWNTNAIEVDGGLLGNAYSSGGWRYRTANSAFMLQVSGNQGTLFNTAPAGAPGQLISFVNALTFADSGNIGVGNVSPNYKLDVSGPVNSNACYFVNGVSFACSDGASGINLTNVTNINGLPPGTGTGGSGGQIEETPVGRMDGTNTSFTLSHAPGPNALSLFLDGVLQQQGVDYTLSGNTITYTVAPNSADWHVAVYGLGGEAFPVMSVFGRTGAVVAVSGDYVAAQVTNAVDQTGSYANPNWITSLDYSKITNAPAPGAGQTPWLSNIDAAGFTLDNASLIRATVNQSSPPTTGAGLEMSWQSTYGQIQAFDRSVQQYRPIVFQGSPMVFMQGMIGIGTTGPQYSLDTVGDINITGQYRVNGTPLALGQNQTPWLSNIDAGQYQLNNASQINFQSSAAPIRSGYINCNAAGMTLATGTGTALSISAVNAITIASNISINSNASAPGGAAYTWGVANGVNAMSIYANARVSIGLTTAPQYNLDIAGSVNITGQYLVNGSPLSTGGYWQAGSPAGAIYYSGGSVGIGTSSPQSPLDVDGNIRMSGTRSVLFVHGDVSTQAAGFQFLPVNNTGTTGIINLTDNSGNPAANSQILFGGFGTYNSSIVDLAVSGAIGINYTGTPDALTINGLGPGAGYSQVRMAYGNYGVLLRNDGANFYVMLTNSGDPFGAWRSPFPIGIDLSTGNVTIPSLVSNASIPSYYAAMTGGAVVLNSGWQNMPGCVFTVNQTGRFLVIMNVELQNNGNSLGLMWFTVNGTGTGQQLYNYVLGTANFSQSGVYSISAGQQLSLIGLLSAGTQVTVYPACTNLTAIYLGP